MPGRPGGGGSGWVSGTPERTSRRGPAVGGGVESRALRGPDTGGRLCSLRVSQKLDPNRQDEERKGSCQSPEKRDSRPEGLEVSGLFRESWKRSGPRWETCSAGPSLEMFFGAKVSWIDGRSPGSGCLTGFTHCLRREGEGKQC